MNSRSIHVEHIGSDDAGRSQSLRDTNNRVQTQSYAKLNFKRQEHKGSGDYDDAGRNARE
jgi:hypothetical protein